MHFPEDELTVCCVRWFTLQYKNRVIWHTPNGGKRNAREAGRLKAMGVLPGVPDLFIAEPNKYSHGLFVELKIKPNKTTDKQKRVIAQLQTRGFTVEICYTLQDFIKVVQNFLSLESDNKEWDEKAKNSYIC